jgi:hypothetical protein
MQHRPPERVAYDQAKARLLAKNKVAGHLHSGASARLSRLQRDWVKFEQNRHSTQIRAPVTAKTALPWIEEALDALRRPPTLAVFGPQYLIKRAQELLEDGPDRQNADYCAKTDMWGIGRLRR